MKAPHYFKIVPNQSFGYFLYAPNYFTRLMSIKHTGHPNSIYWALSTLLFKLYSSLFFVITRASTFQAYIFRWRQREIPQHQSFPQCTVWARFKPGSHAWAEQAPFEEEHYLGSLNCTQFF